MLPNQSFFESRFIVSTSDDIKNFKMIQLRKCWRKLFFIILSISLIFIIYQLYYYRLLVNVATISSSQGIVGPSASLFGHSSLKENLDINGKQHNNNPIVIDDQIRSPDNSDDSSVHFSDLIIGIDDHHMEQYRRAFRYRHGYFHCLNSEPIMLIDEKYFNDDYCDCPDGSDEPSTSACSSLLLPLPSSPSSKPLLFHCQSPSSSCPIVAIPYHRVNDG